MGLLDSFEVTGSATTSVDFSGLNIGKDKELLVVYDVVGVNTSNLYLFINNGTTITNYYNQELLANSTTVSGARANNPLIATLINTENTSGRANVKLANSGYVEYQANNVKAYNTTTLKLEKHNGSTTGTVASITQLTFTSSTANGIGVGSKFWVYELN